MKLTILDQAAIDHVASVSKHTHAAMIVKWLITGWDVEFQHAIGKWKISDFPTWSPGSKYRLIEPKPAKPAYRVYVSKISGQTFSRNSAEDGTRDNSLTPSSEWLSDDWIEYDPPKKWPTPLVERIAAIDIKAAEWIVAHWDDLLDDKYTYKNNYSRDCDTLSHMFDWETPPQGTDYWGSISDKLGE